MEGSEQVVEDPLFREINLHDEEQESIDDSPPPYESVIRESPKETRDDGGESLEWDHNGSEKSLDTVGSMFDDFEVQVVDPVRQGEGVGAYISYKVVSTVSMEGYRTGRHDVIRRFRDFTWLKNCLRKENVGIIVPPMPPKNVVEKYKMTPEFIEERRRGLEVFLKKVLSHKELRKSPELKLFLQADESEFSIEASRTAADLGASAPAESGGASSLARKTFTSASKFFKSISENTGISPPKMPNGYSGGGEQSPEYNAIRGYYQHLEAHLNEVHQQAERLTRQHHRLAKSFAEFGESMKTLSSKIESPDIPDNEYCSILGERATIASHGWEQSAKELNLRFEAPLMEFLRAARSARRAMEDRDELFDAVTSAKSDLDTKRARVAKLQSTPGMRQDRIMEAERDLQTALALTQETQAKYEAAMRRMDADIIRFQKERASDLKHILLHFAQIQADSRQMTAKAWHVPKH